MNIDEAVRLNKPKLNECRSDVMVNTQANYTNDFDSDEFDFNADIAKELARQQEIFEHELNDLTGDPTKAKVGQGPDLHIGGCTDF